MVFLVFSTVNHDFRLDPLPVFEKVSILITYISQKLIIFDLNLINLVVILFGLLFKQVFMHNHFVFEKLLIIIDCGEFPFSLI